MRQCELKDCEEVFEPYPANKRFCKPEHKREAENQRRRELVEDVVTAIETRGDVDLEGGEEDENYVEFLRRENRRLANLAEKRKFQNHDAAEEIYRAAYDALSGIEIKPVKPPKPNAGKGEEEVANVICSDWQAGKNSPSYNSDVLRNRIEKYGDKILSITDVQRSDHPVNRAHVYFLGDIVENETGIFPGQQWEVDTSLYQQIVNCVEMGNDLIRRLLSYFESLHVVGVIGNHGCLSGRTSGAYNPESNADRMVYRFIEMMNRDQPRVTFSVPDGFGERNFHTIDEISTPSGSLRQLLIHGDQMPKPTTLHSYHKKITAWRSGVLEPFDTVWMGHYHQPTKITIGPGITLRVSGAVESDNMYAKEVCAASSEPTQPLQFVRGDIGVTAEYDVRLN